MFALFLPHWFVLKRTRAGATVWPVYHCLCFAATCWRRKKLEPSQFDVALLPSAGSSRKQKVCARVFSLHLMTFHVTVTSTWWEDGVECFTNGNYQNIQWARVFTVNIPDPCNSNQTSQSHRGTSHFSQTKVSDGNKCASYAKSLSTHRVLSYNVVFHSRIRKL